MRGDIVAALDVAAAPAASARRVSCPPLPDGGGPVRQIRKWGSGFDPEHRSLAPDNRRAVVLVLTDEGRELLARFTEVRDERLARVLKDYPSEKLEQVAVLLDELSILLLDLDEDKKQRCLRCSLQFRRGCLMRDVLGRECVLTRDALGFAGAE